MKKILSIFLLLSLALTLCACGGNEAASSTDSASDVVSESTDTDIEINDSEVKISGAVYAVSEDGFYLLDRGTYYFIPSSEKVGKGDMVFVTFDSSSAVQRTNGPFGISSYTELPSDTKISVLMAPEKPVIYLYPRVETEVFVRVDFKGQFTRTIPEHGDGWSVIASPDGTLTVNGQTYPYLFWEGIVYDAEMPMDVGYCVAGSDVEAFFSDVLIRMGLTPGEAADFMEYWVPRMAKNPYNIIAFQTEAYEAIAPLTVSPVPDAVLRIFMTYRASDVPADLPAPKILPFERKGFTLVEWGGGELK